MKNYFLLVLLLLPFCSSFAIEKSVTVESFTGNEVLLNFKPRNWQCDTLDLPDGAFLQFWFENANFNTERGHPHLPFQMVNLGMPADAAVHLEILGAESRKISNALPAPVPTLERQDGFRKKKYTPDPKVYQTNQSLPQNPVEIVETGVLRNQPVVRVKFCPVQYNLLEKSIRIYAKIRVRIVFDAGARMKLPLLTGKETDESIYQQTLLNYPQSRKWRLSRPVQQKPLAPNFQSGECLKIFIEKSGFYQLTGSELTAFGINISAIDPATLRLFNNGGEVLPQNLNASRPNGFLETAIQVSGAEDGRFDAGDAILFFGQSPEKTIFDPETREFTHTLNPYSKSNVYWLTWGDTAGKRMAIATAFQNPQLQKTTFTDFRFVEEELLNVLQSGTSWFGRKFRADGLPLNYTLNLKSPVPDSPVQIRAQFCLIGYGPHEGFLDFKDNRLETFKMFGNDNEDVIYKLIDISANQVLDLADGLNEFQVGYVSPGANGSCLVDWLEITYQRELVFENDPLFFNSAPDSGVIEFRIRNLQSEPVQIFNVSRFDSVTQIQYTQNGNMIQFVDSVWAEVPAFYLAVTPSQYRTVTNAQIANLANLRGQNPGADYLIIAPSQFYEAAMILKSLRENVDSLDVRIFDSQDIYNEFGCGIADPVALRDFIKFIFENGTPQPRYVVLLGDGHFDYKGISTSQPNWIPPFETDETNVTTSRSIDDFFVCIRGNDKLMDLSIGRLPVSTSEEARNLVNKICHYESDSAPGSWRNTVTIVADDEYVQNGRQSLTELYHTTQAEDLAALFPAGFDLTKIYLINYPVVRNASVSGITKPQVNEDLVSQINQGTVILDMIGHSHEWQFAHENVFSMSNDVPLLENANRLPFLVVASCAFGRFDGAAEKFIAEEMLVKQNGGVIASFASTRLSFPNANSALNNYLMRSLFLNPVNPMRLGDAARTAKNLYQNINTEKYHLLGDPALVLKTPRETFRINTVSPDSLRALSRVTVNGGLDSPRKLAVSDELTLHLKVFDSVQNLTYTAAPGRSVRYKMPGNVIFRGTARVVDGQFQVKFVVPKDISYGGNAGRISGYINGGGVSATGYRNNIYLGGTDTSLRDYEGPKITIGFKNRHFQSGDVVPENPVLEVTICDSGCGINLTGEVGHKITLVCDDVTAQKVDVTALFNYERDSFYRGTFEYPLNHLKPGNHRVKIKAWDNFNNSSTEEANFVIVADGKLLLQNVLNYPNPFRDETSFTCNVNLPAEISIRIYTLAGRLIRQMPPILAQQGFNLLCEWDGTDAEGDRLANGVYLYQISARSEAGEQVLKAEAIGKLIIMK